MPKTATTIRCTATLHRPADAPRSSTWAFLILPGDASAKLPRRGRVIVKGTLNGATFRATLEPDGNKSHWLKVPNKLRQSAGACVGEAVTLELSPLDEEPEPAVPPALRQALNDPAHAKAKAVWQDITPLARQDWVHWITSAKKQETVARRITTACDMLAHGKRRPCCFDRSGVYSKGFSAPKAAE
jgi:hypothetical protein